MAESNASAKAQSDTTTAVSAAMIGISVIAVAMRFYTRYCLKTGLWWDDWLALAALVSAVAAGAFVLAGTLISDIRFQSASFQLPFPLSHSADQKMQAAILRH